MSIPASRQLLRGRAPSAGTLKQVTAAIMQVSLNARLPRTLQRGCAPIYARSSCSAVPAAGHKAPWRSLWNLALSAAGPAVPPPGRRATFVAPHKAIALLQPRPRRGKNRRDTK